jgi:hypothetical protein
VCEQGQSLAATCVAMTARLQPFSPKPMLMSCATMTGSGSSAVGAAEAPSPASEVSAAPLVLPAAYVAFPVKLRSKLTCCYYCACVSDIPAANFQHCES